MRALLFFTIYWGSWLFKKSQDFCFGLLCTCTCLLCSSVLCPKRPLGNATDLGTK